MAVRLRCPSCRDTFKWDGPWPNHCPMCGASVGMGDKPEVASPHISSGRAKALSQSADMTYRGMEAASAANAEQAADMLGTTAADTQLKITNLKDNLRPGESAAPPPPVNDVTRVMEARGANSFFGNQGAEAGRFFADSTPKTGPYARAGAKGMSSLRDFHQGHAPAIIAAGETEHSRRARTRRV